MGCEPLAIGEVIAERGDSRAVATMMAGDAPVPPFSVTGRNEPECRGSIEGTELR